MLNLSQSAFCQSIMIDELECLHIKHPKFFAEICLQGAQLTKFQHFELGQFVWLSPTAEYKKGQGLRGGIPICWPWFGVLEKNPKEIVDQVLTSELAHGFARTQSWELHSIQESAHDVTVECLLKQTPKSLAIWPFPFELRCRFHFSDKLRIELITINTGLKTFTFSQALHTYLNVKDIGNVRIYGANNHQYVDALDHWQTKRQQGTIVINQEVDRIYQGKINYQLYNGEHHLTLSSNSASSVVWNPWVKKSKTLSQFPHTAYKSMLCIENGNILDDVVNLEKDQRHCLSMTLEKN